MRQVISWLPAGLRRICLCFLVITGVACSDRGKTDQPNIVYILTDQQAFDALSCAGNELVSTPSLDRLAASGVRFSQAYCTFPLYVPSRASIFTGRMPHKAGIFVNTSTVQDEEMPFPTLASVLSESGYYTHYRGKWNLTIPSSDTLKHGFQGIDHPGTNGFDSIYAKRAIEFLRKNLKEPFFLVVSFVNPHDCCLLAWKEDLSRYEGSIPPMPQELPELPGNFEIPENEPDYLRTWQKKHSEKVYWSYFWEENDFREYQWGYYRLVEPEVVHLG